MQTGADEICAYFSLDDDEILEAIFDYCKKKGANLPESLSDVNQPHSPVAGLVRRASFQGKTVAVDKIELVVDYGMEVSS